MRTSTKILLAGVAGLLAFGTVPALAQQPAKQAAVPQAGAGEKTPAAGEKTAEPAKPAEPPKEEQAPTVYTYEVGGRRDPFRSLLLRNAGEAHGPRPPGLAGMLVDELELQGTIKVKSGWVAMMRGTDNRAYLLKKGSTVFDGEVIDVTATEVTFRQNVNDPTNPKPFRDVVKSLSLQRKGS